jgi:hypothetical protein
MSQYLGEAQREVIVEAKEHLKVAKDIDHRYRR